MSPKSQKRRNRKHHNPFGHKQFGFYAKAYRQLVYIRKNWVKKKTRFKLPKGLEA